MLINKNIQQFIISVGIILLSGCATVDDGKKIDENIVKIERQNSRIAGIGQVTVYQQKEGYLIRGKVTRNAYIRGHISGHLDIQLFNPKGKVVFKTSARYQHKGLRFNNESFSIVLKHTIKKGSRLRITHIEASSHNKNTESFIN